MWHDLGPRYRPIRLLGSGGVGQVWLVHDTHLDQDVALKALAASAVTARSLETLEREFALLARIDHPAIARAHDFGKVGDRPYFTRDYIAGAALPEGRVWRRSFDAFIEVATGITEPLAFLHQNDILHLDVKPANAIVASATPSSPERPAERRVVLIDFGLFRSGSVDVSEDRVRGTVPYMAPEYFLQQPLGPWTDVYALGVTLYLLATGRLPRRTARGELGSIGSWEGSPPAPSSLVAGIPSELDSILSKCIGLDPSHRFASCGDVLEALRLLSNGASRDPVAVGPQTIRTLGRTSQLRAVERFLAGIAERDARRSALVVTGPRGIGVSHFLRDVKIHAQTHGWGGYLETGYAGRSTRPGALLRSVAKHLRGSARTAWESLLARPFGPRARGHNETTDRERRLRWRLEALRALRELREPVVLIVDGLQHHDEVSVAMVLELLRSLERLPGEERPPLAFVLGYREEGTSARTLEELTDLLTRSDPAVVLSLPPLGLGDAARLHDMLAGPAAGARSMAVLQATWGVPGEIAARATAGATSRDGSNDTSPTSELEAALSDEQRHVLLALALLERGASAAELARLAESSSQSARSTLRALAEGGLVRETARRGGRVEWVAESAAARALSSTPATARVRMHRRIADELLRAGARRDEARVVEAVRHLRAAGRRADLVKHGVAAARYLRRTLQYRAALAMYAVALDAVPSRRTAQRVRLALEVAELHGLVGTLREGIDLLRPLVAASRRSDGVRRARLLLALAGLHSRRGDLRRADALFEEGRRAAGDRLPAREQLVHLNDHAALKAIIGDHAGAKSLCARGLELARGKRDITTREAELALRATLANVDLRTHNYEAAVAGFEAALDLAETIGSESNRCLALNNLGVALIQCDRHAEAIRAFTEAERSCLRLDQGPSLVSIYANLAILQARTGAHEAAERALEKLEELQPGAIGQRQRYFLEHAAGVARSYRGRYARAAPRLESAVRLAASMGDAHAASYGRLHLADALVFSGAPARALETLREVEEDPCGVALARRVAARRALVHALSGERERVLAELEAARGAAAAQSIPFLDAWDDLLLGWACAMVGKDCNERDGVQRAELYFAECGLAPALSLSRAVLCESRWRRGDAARALEELRRESQDDSHELAAVHRALLEARLLLERSGAVSEVATILALVSDAGVRLLGNPLPAWSAMLDSLREELDGSRVPRDVESTTVATGEREATRTRSVLHQTADALPSRSVLVVRSARMRALATTLDRLRGAEVPVLISGETGAGKELVARVLHAESQRAGAPLVVVDCAALPEGLFEAELFGAVAGAFTDLSNDRDGVLARAAGGAVLVDEVAAIPPALQPKLLRLLSERTYRRLGAEYESETDARFVFTTSRDLDEEVRQGRFRVELLHRIRVVEVEVPPLRERAEDVSDLVERFVRDARQPALALDADACERLQRAPWPGNVRELGNFVARLCLELPPEGPRRVSRALVDRLLEESSAGSVFPRELLDRPDIAALQRDLDRDHLLHHYRRLDCDTRRLAEFLNVSRKQLYKRLSRLGVRLLDERRRARRS